MLVAPPGAGKTTRVPLDLLDAPWLGKGKIVLLEPRRLAARAAAARMAKTLGEEVGGTVGLRVRLGSKISARTRIEVVTEGVFTRMILDDPELTGIGAVLFDEFHERSLDADLGLALALDAQGGLREDLRILVMSATLDGARVAGLLNDAPVVASEGRAFPVETRYLDRDPNRRIEDSIGGGAAGAAGRSRLGAGLPAGAGRDPPHGRGSGREGRAGGDPGAPLRRAHPGRAGQGGEPRAPRPAQGGARHLHRGNLADHRGRAHRGRFRPRAGAGLRARPRPHPPRHRAGLAGGGGPAPGPRGPHRARHLLAALGRGRQRRPGAFAKPEILSSDLAGLLLDCAAWGVPDPRNLAFLDPPPAPALAEARTMLDGLGALDADGRLTETGRRLRALPLPPRLARMVATAAQDGRGRAAANLAAVLVERGLGGDAVDLDERVERFARDRGGRATDMRRLAENWARIAGAGGPPSPARRGRSWRWPSRIASPAPGAARASS